MVGVVLASHGEFAEGILQSSTMVFGEQEDVKAVTLMPNEGPADIKAKMEKRTALRRLGNPEDVAGPVLAMLSDCFGYMTGTYILLDGGQTIGG